MNDPTHIRVAVSPGPHQVFAPECKVTMASPLRLRVGEETVEVGAQFVGVTPDGAIAVDIQLPDSARHLADRLRADLDIGASIDFRQT